MMNGWAIIPFECNEARTSRHCDTVVGEKHSVELNAGFNVLLSQNRGKIHQHDSHVK